MIVLSGISSSRVPAVVPLSMDVASSVVLVMGNLDISRRRYSFELVMVLILLCCNVVFGVKLLWITCLVILVSS